MKPGIALRRFSGSGGNLPNPIVGGDIVLLVRPGGAAGDTTITDESPVGRTLTRLGSTVVVSSSHAPGGTALGIADSYSGYYMTHTSDMNPRGGAFQIEGSIEFSAAPGTEQFATVLFIGDGSYYDSYEWGIFVHGNYLRFYWGVRGSSQAVLRFHYPGDITLSAGVRYNFSVGRDSSGNWGGWLNGGRCPKYYVRGLAPSPPPDSTSTSPITGTYNSTLDLGDTTAAINPVYLGSVFGVDVGARNTKQDQICFTVGGSRDVSRNYTVDDPLP